jgi:pilus assembly protein CpaD
MSSNRIRPEPATKSRLVMAAVSAAALCLAACASDPGSPARTAVNPGALYPVQAEIKADQLALALHAGGLSPAQVQALTVLAARWREEGEDAIVLQAPHGGANPVLAGRAQSDAHTLLLSLGVPEAGVRLAAYDAADPKAPLLVSFPRYAAKTIACGRHWDDLSATRDNTVQSNFGCAVAANMAAQIAHPADIAHPRNWDEPNADRRETVLGKYAAGKVTASDDDPAKSGNVSRAVP